jgi:predicted ATPase
MCTWNGHFISGVDPKIAESIFKRTDGNPFFIRSLVMALKESGQWRVSPSGQLTTPDPNFDFDKLVLGYDNQSIVLAQFDRLDRNFQLFLKVASVLGMKFALDDVLYFLTGFADASQHIDRKKYNQIISGLQATDKYQFLQKESVGPDGGYFQFKSALVKKCIYSMMVHNQRQQIHLLVARYLESKMNEQNRHRYVVQVLDHYMNTGASHKLKRIYYTEMAANYFFEKETPSETIKYCKQLLELIGDSKPEELAEVSNLQIANFHRELGYALMMKDELDEAEEQLIKSLEIMGHTLPASGYKFNWALKAQISKRKKLDKTFFKDRPVPQEEDYTQSYVARKGASGYSLSNLVAGPTAVKLQGIIL